MTPKSGNSAPKCKHRWRLSSWSGITASSTLKTLTDRHEYTEKCRCGATRTDLIRNNVKLFTRLKLQDKEFQRHIKVIHGLAWAFRRQFGGNGCGKYKYKGYDFIERAEKWAVKQPGVQVAYCDDNHHCGSVVILIPHKDLKAKRPEDRYWGTSVIIIPQCTGEEAMEIFLYPGHRRSLLAALQAVVKLPKKEPSPPKASQELLNALGHLMK